MEQVQGRHLLHAQVLRRVLDPQPDPVFRHAAPDARAGNADVGPAQPLRVVRAADRCGEVPGVFLRVRVYRLELRQDPGVEVEGHEGRQHGDADLLANARLPAAAERREDALRQQHRRRERAVGVGDETGARPVRDVLVDGHPPGLRGDERIVPVEIATRPLRAVAGDGGVDRPRVRFVHLVEADAEPLGHARPEACHHNIGRADELQGSFPAGVGLQIEDDALLPAIPCLERRNVARGVAVGRLDFDHLGAVVGEDHRRQRPDHPPAKVDDPNAVTWCAHSRASFAVRLLCCGSCVRLRVSGW